MPPRLAMSPRPVRRGAGGDDALSFCLVGHPRRFRVLFARRRQCPCLYFLEYTLPMHDDEISSGGCSTGTAWHRVLRACGRRGRNQPAVLLRNNGGDGGGAGGARRASLSVPRSGCHRRQRPVRGLFIILSPSCTVDSVVCTMPLRVRERVRTWHRTVTVGKRAGRSATSPLWDLELGARRSDGEDRRSHPVFIWSCQGSRRRAPSGQARPCRFPRRSAAAGPGPRRRMWVGVRWRPRRRCGCPRNVAGARRTVVSMTLDAAPAPPAPGRRIEGGLCVGGPASSVF